MLTVDETADMRTDLELSLPDLATVIRITKEDDGRGGRIDVETESGPFPVRVSPADMTPEEKEAAERIQATMLWILTLPAGTVVLAADRIKVGTRTFEVAAPATPRSYEISARVYCVEML